MERKPIGLMITDTHLDEDNFKIVESVHKQAIAATIALGLGHVIHLGDHFECRTSQSLAVLLGMKKIIELYEKANIHLYTISGNHDKTDQSVSDSYIDVYSSDWFHNLDGQSVPVGDVDFHFLSYYEEGAYQKRLKKLKGKGDNDQKVLITHYGVDGVLNNDDRAVESNVKSNSFKEYERVFIGHYHNASNPTDTVHYIGSTDPRNFGEDDNKGATIIYEDLSFELLQFSFKSYKKIIIDDFDFENVEELIKEHKDNDSHIRLEFVGKRDELIRVDKKKLNEAGIQVNTIDTTLIDLEGISEVGKVTIGMTKGDVLKYLDEYSDQNEIPKKNLEKIIKKF